MVPAKQALRLVASPEWSLYGCGQQCPGGCGRLPHPGPALCQCPAAAQGSLQKTTGSLCPSTSAATRRSPALPLNPFQHTSRPARVVSNGALTSLMRLWAVIPAQRPTLEGILRLSHTHLESKILHRISRLYVCHWIQRCLLTSTVHERGIIPLVILNTGQERLTGVLKEHIRATWACAL